MSKTIQFRADETLRERLVNLAEREHMELSEWIRTKLTHIADQKLVYADGSNIDGETEALNKRLLTAQVENAELNVVSKKIDNEWKPVFENQKAVRQFLQNRGMAQKQGVIMQEPEKLGLKSLPEPLPQENENE